MTARVPDVSRGLRRTSAAVERARAAMPSAAALAPLAGRLAWFCCRVRPGSERAAAEALVERGLVGWTPLRAASRRLGQCGRRVQVLAPATPGYVLTGFEGHADWSAAMRCAPGYAPLTAGWAADGRPVLRPLGERAVRALLAIEGALRADAAPAPALAVGDRVRVELGSWAEIEAMVEALDGPDAVLAVRMLGAVRRVRLPRAQLALAS